MPRHASGTRSQLAVESSGEHETRPPRASTDRREDVNALAGSEHAGFPSTPASFWHLHERGAARYAHGVFPCEPVSPDDPPFRKPESKSKALAHPTWAPGTNFAVLAVPPGPESR